MKKDQLKRAIQASRKEESGIDALFSPTNAGMLDEAGSKKKVKTLRKRLKN